MIGLGVLTYNRPGFAEKCVKSISRNCASAIDHVAIYNDGSSEKLTGEYKRVYKALPPGSAVFDVQDNHGVAHAKNQLIEHFLSLGCDWIFLCEDDLKILAPQAVSEYVHIAESNKVHHLSFAHHGPANYGVPLGDGDISYFPHSIGAWCSYSAECLQTVGLHDEFLVNAWEHVELELRLIQAGLMGDSNVHSFPDATYSQDWIIEQPNSIEKSSIRPRPDWHTNIRNGLIYWRDAKPDTFEMLFGSDKPLHGYATSIIG